LAFQHPSCQVVFSHLCKVFCRALKIAGFTLKILVTSLLPGKSESARKKYFCMARRLIFV
jgi:hypothetical protein